MVVSAEAASGSLPAKGDASHIVTLGDDPQVVVNTYRMSCLGPYRHAAPPGALVPLWGLIGLTALQSIYQDFCFQREA